jgi:hypothetical protein
MTTIETDRPERRGTPDTRRAALDLLTDARRDPDAFTRRGLWESANPRRSAWRTFSLAANMAARLSTRALLSESGNAHLWAEVFALLNDRKERALAWPFQTPVKRG